MWSWIPGGMSLLLLQALLGVSLATGDVGCSHGHLRNCLRSPLNHRLWQPRGLRPLDWLDLQPLGGASGYPPSQIYRFVEDSLNLLNSQELTLRQALKPYFHLLNQGQTQDSEDQVENCNTWNKLVDLSAKKAEEVTKEPLSENEIEQNRGYDVDNDMKMYDHSHSLKEAQQLWNNWQKEVEDFLGVGESESAENDEEILMRERDDEIKRQEMMFQEQLRKEEELEKALERERSERRVLQERIEKQKEEMAKQKEKELEEKRAREQREAILKEKRRQVELENLRMERDRVLRSQREEEERMRFRHEEIERRRNKETRRQAEIERREKAARQKHQNAPKHNTNRDRSHVNPKSDRSSHHNPLNEIYSTQIPEYYSPRDLSVTKKGPRVEINGKRVCGCDENCVIKEFERGFSLPKDTFSDSLKAVLYKDGTLSVYGSRGKHTSTDEDRSTNMAVPLESIDFPEQDVNKYKDRLECLRKKAGVKVYKMDKRSGRVFDSEEFRDVENEYRRQYNEHEYEDDGVTIEIVE